MESIEKAYLTPPDNEAIPVLKCFFCEEDICEGNDYYVLNGFYCCKDCLDIHFKFTAEPPDYDSQCRAAGGRGSGAGEQEEIQSSAKCSKRAMRQYF